jgi:hypothetical protein
MGVTVQLVTVGQGSEVKFESGPVPSHAPSHLSQFQSKTCKASHYLCHSAKKGLLCAMCSGAVFDNATAALRKSRPAR